MPKPSKKGMAVLTSTAKSSSSEFAVEAVVRKDHGWPKGCRSGGEFCIPLERKGMANNDIDVEDQVRTVIRTVHESVSVMQLMYYYLILLPPQRKQVK